MARSTAGIILILFFLAGITGYNYIYRPFANTPQSQVPETSPEPNSKVSVVESAAASLSSREKIAQLLAVPATLPIPTNEEQIIVPLSESTVSAQISDSTRLPITKNWLGLEKPGFVVLFGKQITKEAARKTITSLHEVIDRPMLENSISLPVWIALDHEGGSVQRFSGVGFTLLPSWRELCSMDALKRRELLIQSASDLEQVGVQLVLAPVLDVATAHPYLKSRICSDDPVEVSERAQEFIQVMETSKVLSVVKHFPGIGQTKRDLHTAFDRVTVSPEEAQVYRSVLDVYPSIGVMVSHVGVTNQYAELPCSLSADCVGQVKFVYPKALTITDAIEMDSAGYTGVSKPKMTVPERVVAAFNAGNDVVLFGEGISQTEISQVLTTADSLYISDPIFAQKIDSALKKVLQYKLENAGFKPESE